MESIPENDSTTVKLTIENDEKNDNNDDDNDIKQRKKLLIYSAIKNHFWILPFICSIVILLAAFIPYITTVYYDYTDPIFPLISDSAGYPPGASIFSLLLLIAIICSMYLSIFSIIIII